MPEAALQKGETVLATWRPSLRVFLKKLLAVTVLTTLLLSPLGWTFDPVVLLIGVPLLLVAYALVFDDYTEWMRRRTDRWQLTNRRLILANDFEANPPVSVPLHHIKAVRPWLGWALRVDLANGQTTVMSFLPGPKQVREQILGARAPAMEDAHV